MTITAPSLATEAAGSYGYPSERFNQRERQLLLSVKTYVDAATPSTIITTQGDLIVGNASGDAIRLAKGTSGLALVAGASTVSYAQLASGAIANAAVSIEHLDTGILYSHRVFAAGSFTTASGSASQTITVASAASTDIAFVVLKTVGGTPRTVLTAAAATGQINVVMSGDPSTDHVLSYQLLRAAV